MGRISDLMLQAGRARATGIAAAGQANGQAIASLGSILRDYRAGKLQDAQLAAEQQYRADTLALAQARDTRDAAAETRAATTFSTEQGWNATQHAMALHDYSVRALGAVLGTAPERRQQAWSVVRSGLIDRGIAQAGEIPEAYPGDDAVQAEQQALLSIKDRMDLQGQGEDRALRRQQQAATDADRKADNARAESAAAETRRHNEATEAAARARADAASARSSTSDIALAVQGMKEGTLPPMLPGRASKEYLATMAEAKRQGYDLASAATDWQATQKHIATLNGAQQTRMAQAVDNAAHSLDVIETLAGQWKGGRFPVLNRGNLAAAKAGVYGAGPQAIAVQLDAQIADVTSELANVYMGGNSPTDHALTLAAKNLSADWSEQTLKTMLDQTRANLTIRQNSMRNVGVAGASPNNPYAPVQPTLAPTGGLPEVGGTFQGGRVLKVERVK